MHLILCTRGTQPRDRLIDLEAVSATNIEKFACH